MELTHTINRYRHARYTLFKLRDEIPLVYKLGMAFCFACLTGLAAQVRIPLPFTPVPITGQVLVVLLSGIALGGCYGGLSQVFYLGFGAAGLPWFNGWSGGLGVVTGVTGGYIVGFIPAALAIGWLTDRCVSVRKFHFQLLLMAAGVGIIYASGAAQFAVVMDKGLINTMKLAVFPFIPFDLMKAAIAACMSAAVLPRSAMEDNGL